MNEWYNENELRSYPVVEDSSQTDVDGKALGFGLIADLAVSVPRDLGDDVYLSLIAITPALVSVSIASPAGGMLVGTYAQPVVPHVPLSLTPIVDDVSGFVVFGSDILDVTGTFKFDEDATPLEVRAVRQIDRLPVTAIRQLATPTELEGIVDIVVSSNMAVRADGQQIIFSLIDEFREDFVGPCDKQGTLAGCGKPPIRLINNVGPDSEGKITIEVE